MVGIIAFSGSGCERKAESSKFVKGRDLKKEALARADVWEVSDEKDVMTDRVTHRLSMKASRRQDLLAFECDERSERVFFGSDMFIAAGQPAEMLIRYDDEEPSERTAFAHKSLAMIERLPYRKGRSDLLASLGPAVTFLQMRTPHKRLRVRLTSFDGESRDLVFPISDLHIRLRELEKKCGIDDKW